MKKATILILACLAIIISSPSAAQKILSASGDASVLKGQKNVNLVFTYEDVMVGEMTEEAYIEKRMSEYREDSPGEAGKWLEEWKSNREYYETFFVEQLNKKLRKFQTEFGENQQDAEYSLFINIHFIEVGWFGGLVSGSAMVMMKVDVCKTTEPDQPLATYEIGGVGDEAKERKRIAMAYKFAANVFGKYLKKKVYK